jgi:hypothetical protein
MDRTMSTRFYDTDLTDEAWAWVAPVLPAARPGGRPRTTNLRAVLNAKATANRPGRQRTFTHVSGLILNSKSANERRMHISFLLFFRPDI